MSSSNYINTCRRNYALYTMQTRAIPSIADGLKSGARRALWQARDGSLVKSATLAGAAMPLHPHQSPEGAIDTLAAPYGNNICLLSGSGAFGTLLAPRSYGASRYTSVKASQFAHDVLYCDIDIIPMVDNYDWTLTEPKFFLPLVPLVILNPVSGIALGHASNILPHNLADIIDQQIKYLKHEPVTDVVPSVTFLNQIATKTANRSYVFTGSFDILDKTSLRITSLPYGIDHEEYLCQLDNLIGSEIIDYIDNSQKTINIVVKFKRGAMGVDRDQLLKLLKLTYSHNENLNVLDFDGDAILCKQSTSDIISKFTEWRLNWYIARYQYLKNKLIVATGRLRDVIITIEHKGNQVAASKQSKTQLMTWLTEIGVGDVEYIAQLPIYRFTESEKLKVEKEIEANDKQLKTYDKLITSRSMREKVYITELTDVLTKYHKGIYTKMKVTK